mmetsp:Transcript_376/g.588  ORF Transcript_376/g.588 Transcript_376/m.588 type:complete len:325 (+) Transcript_376:154-1128(+)
MSFAKDDKIEKLIQDASVIDTAFWVARERAQCSFVEDPLASQVAGCEGEKICRFTQGYDEEFAKICTISVGARTVYLDSLIKDFVQQGGEQLVVMAAGMDTRAFRLRELVACNVYEVDFPETFKMKRERLGDAKHSCLNRVEIPLDISKGNWDDCLLGAGFDKSKVSFFLLEGLVMYLPKEANMDIFRKVSKLSCKGSMMAGDWQCMATINMFMPKPLDMIDYITRVMCKAPFVWGPRDSEHFKAILRENGMEVDELLNYDLHQPAFIERLCKILGYKPAQLEHLPEIKLSCFAKLWIHLWYLPGIYFGRIPKVTGALYLAKKK